MMRVHPNLTLPPLFEVPPTAIVSLRSGKVSVQERDLPRGSRFEDDDQVSSHTYIHTYIHTCTNVHTYTHVGLSRMQWPP